jgi:anaerobic ribonucleoside-triphosphate reductase activating protein
VALTAAGAGQVPWRVHAVVPRSRANGPGLRYVIWAQGCTLACPGCFNPRTHPVSIPNAPAVPVPRPLTADGLAGAVLAEAGRAARDGCPLDGVTLTGGEPLEQPAALAAFTAILRKESDLGIIVLTGFTRGEVERDPRLCAAVADADMVIAGRYNAALRLASGLRGSANKEYWQRSTRYRAGQFRQVPEVELIIGPDGGLTVTGTPLDVIAREGRA